MPRRLSSSCRQFRRLDVEYVDGFLVGEALQACDLHLDACPACRRHDVMVRRSLLALQALPVIEPSAGFQRRLYDRIAHDALYVAPSAPHRVRWGVAAMLLAASAALLVVAPSPASRTRTPSVAVVPAPALMSPSHAREASFREISAAPAKAAPEGTPRPTRLRLGARPVEGRTARFEALPGRAPLRTEAPVPGQHPARLQAVTYIGQ